MDKSITFSTATEMHYHLSGDNDSDTVYLVLHGVMEKGSRMLRRMQEALPEDSLILAPDGPFPIPTKMETGYKVRYAWYFFDNIKNIYVIDYEYSANLLVNLLKALNFDHKKLVIIGYSQGGYLAPFVAQKSPQTKYIIGLACVFKQDLLPEKLTIPFTLVHGRQDSMVSYSGAFSNFEIISKYNKDCHFQTLENTDHFYNELFADTVTKINSKKIKTSSPS